MANLSQKKMYPTPPPSIRVENISQANFAIENLNKHLKALATYSDFQDSLFKSTFLVEGDDIASLSVDKLTAGTIDVDGILVGTGIELAGLSEQIKVGANNNIIIDGVNNNLRVYDDQSPQQLRVLAGQLGANSNVLKFNGTSTTIDCGNPSTLTENIYAIECQFKLNAIPTTPSRALVDKDGKFGIYIKHTTGEIVLWDYNALADRNSGVNVQAGQWYHLFLFIRNGGTDNELWLDGELIYEGFAYNDSSDANDLHIGSFAGIGNYFNGWIREVRYWGCDTNPTFMNASEVKSLDVQNLPSTVRPTNIKTLVSYWELDEGTGSTANDTGDTGGNNGTISNGTWQTIDNNFGIRVMDENGKVIFFSSDKSYMDGNDIINGSIIDAKIANIEWAKIDNVAIVNADILNVSASKITTGTLDAGTVSVINLNAGNINTGTLTVDGTPAISVTSSGAITFTSGGDIEMTATSGDFNYINFYNSSSSLRGTIGLQVSGGFFTFRAPNSATGTWIDSLGDIFIYAGTSKDIVLGDNVVTNLIRCRGEVEPHADSTYGLGNSGIEWVDVWADNTTIQDLQFGNNFVFTEISEAFEGTDLDDGLVLLDNSEPSNVVMVFGGDGKIYGDIEPLTNWVHKNKKRKRTPVERDRTGKHADGFILKPNGKWIRKKQAGWKRDPKTKIWLSPEELAQGKKFVEDKAPKRPNKLDLIN